MELSLDHNPGEDFGSLVVDLERDDSFHLDYDGYGMIRVRIPLYAHEARRMLEALRPLSEEPDAE